jgi:hypothetical protein
MIASEEGAFRRIARSGGAHVRIVCKSYFNAAEAADDLETLIAVGHSPGDITLVMSHMEERKRKHTLLSPRGRETMVCDE